MMKNLTLHVILNTPKPHGEHINLLNAGASDDVNLIKVLGDHTSVPPLQVTDCGSNGFLL